MVDVIFYPFLRAQQHTHQRAPDSKSFMSHGRAGWGGCMEGEGVPFGRGEVTGADEIKIRNQESILERLLG